MEVSLLFYGHKRLRPDICVNAPILPQTLPLSFHFALSMMRLPKKTIFSPSYTALSCPGLPRP